MKATEKRRRIEAGRPALIATLSGMVLRGIPGARELLPQAHDPHIKFAAFQALCRVVASKRADENFEAAKLAKYGTSASSAMTSTGRPKVRYLPQFQSLPFIK